jgi:hypothetical protein
MSRRSGFEATTLREDDLVRFNYWLWITRLGSIAALLTLTILLRYVAPRSVRVGVVALIAGGDLLLSLPYQWWLRRRRYLRTLAYVQLSVDTAAIVAGLFFVRESPLLFHFILLLVVVPASMIEWQCGLVIAALATAGHLLLLSITGRAGFLSIGGLLPPASFFLIAGQSRFYAQYLAQKNAELGAAAASMNQFNARLEEEAAVSAALLRAAQALTTSLEPREILQRLNEVVRETLPCDWSVTLLHDVQQNVYRVAAISGSAPEIDEEVRNFEFPGGSIAPRGGCGGLTPRLRSVSQRSHAALANGLVSVRRPAARRRFDRLAGSRLQ